MWTQERFYFWRFAGRLALWIAGALAAMTVAAALLCAMLVRATAMDRGQYAGVEPSTRAWVEGLKDGHGVGCCATADGIPLEEADWDIQGDHYRVRFGGEWLTVDEPALITEPNRLHRATAWIGFRDGKPFVRCFLPGSGT